MTKMLELVKKSIFKETCNIYTYSKTNENIVIITEQIGEPYQGNGSYLKKSNRNSDTREL